MTSLEFFTLTAELSPIEVMRMAARLRATANGGGAGLSSLASIDPGGVVARSGAVTPNAGTVTGEGVSGEVAHSAVPAKSQEEN